MALAAPARAGGAAEASPIACPAAVGAGVQCLSTRDENGSWVVIAMPERWNRRLVVHAHGGPRMGTPAAEDPLEDLERFSVMVRLGYAWIGSTYRRGGYGVRSAAEDVDNSRELFWNRYGRPDRTLLHGQSWGGNVAAKAAEIHNADGAYDGVFLTNGVLTGGTRAYGFRADLRAVYQFYCQNHPRPNEPQYPVWQGLPPDSALTRRDLRLRVETCTGVDRPARSRSRAQAARLRDILAVTGIEEGQLVAHLSWATFLFRDLVHQRLGGRNPFDNSTTRYAGSSDDAALNAGVERFTADPEAVAMLAHDADLTGLISAPTVTLHALHDPVVFYAAEAAYRRTVEAAGRDHLLLQLAADEADHSKLHDSGYAAALAALESWIDTGDRPDPAQVRAACVSIVRNAGDCRIVP